MKNDDRINKLLKEIDKKRSELGKKSRHVLETNGIFRYPSGDHFNLNVVSDQGKLIDAMSFLLRNEGKREEAARRLGVTYLPEFIHDGYPVSAWETDFKSRITTMTYDKKKRELEALEKQLSSLISADGKTKKELDKIEQLLGD